MDRHWVLRAIGLGLAKNDGGFDIPRGSSCTTRLSTEYPADEASLNKLFLQRPDGSYTHQKP
jgi:hypothetical protein